MTWVIARIGAEIETKLAKVGDSVPLPTFDDLETAMKRIREAKALRKGSP